MQMSERRSLAVHPSERINYAARTRSRKNSPTVDDDSGDFWSTGANSASSVNPRNASLLLLSVESARGVRISFFLPKRAETFRETCAAAIKKKCANVSELMKPPPPLEFGARRRAGE